MHFVLGGKAERVEIGLDLQKTFDNLLSSIQLSKVTHLIPKWRELHENEIIRASFGGIRIKKLAS